MENEFNISDLAKQMIEEFGDDAPKEAQKKAVSTDKRLSVTWRRVAFAAQAILDAEKKPRFRSF